MLSRPKLGGMLLLDIFGHERIVHDWQVGRIYVDWNGDSSSLLMQLHLHFITVHHRMNTMKLMVHPGRKQTDICGWKVVRHTRQIYIIAIGVHKPMQHCAKTNYLVDL